MKNWSSTYIEQAEIIQLILLAHLYGQTDSESLYFQGGTAIRWCYAGNRFSEDLDFETHLDRNEVKDLIRRALPGIKRDLIANIGPGKCELETGRCHEPLCIIWAKFAPGGFRGKIAVKLEFQQSRRDMTPETQPFIFGTLPAIADRIQSGRLKTRGNTVLMTETLPEIMAGKVRALLEREHYKGRDFWDIWYLGFSRQVTIDNAILARKIKLYPFTQRRSKDDILGALVDDRSPIIQAIADDLRRFIPPAAFTALEKSGFSPLLTTTREVLANVRDDVF